MKRNLLSIGLLSLAMLLGGCSTIQGAYDSTVDTVSGWFKSDTKKAEEAKK